LDCYSNQLTDLILPAENKIKELSCYDNPNLKPDFLLNFHPKQMTHLNLDGDLATQLEVHIQEGEKLEEYKSTSELEQGEVNLVQKLVSQGFSQNEAQEWAPWLIKTNLHSDLNLEILSLLHSQNYTPKKLESELRKQKRIFEGQIVTEKLTNLVMPLNERLY